MTGELTPVIAGVTGLVVGGIAYVIALWYERRRLATGPAPKITDTLYAPLIQRSLLDRFVVLRNPGNHEAVIRLIVRGKTVEDIDSLFNNYIDSASHHPAYEGEVAVIHHLKMNQLLEKDKRDKWYMEERYKIMRRYNWSMDQFTKEMSDAWEKYPGLLDDWKP